MSALQQVEEFIGWAAAKPFGARMWIDACALNEEAG